MQWIRHFLPVLTPVHRALLRLTRGRLGGRGLGFRFLLLEHIGRRTGQLRSTPLLFVEHEGRFLVVASNAGQDHHPAWWLNLLARPSAAVELDGRTVPIYARQADEHEARQLWPIVIATFKQFEGYRQGTNREIPLVILDPERASEVATTDRGSPAPP
jgi:deazaflavin-dependent oxidoreductase (nitroreductase family)